MTRQEEIAWAAGLFEGEGSFVLSRPPTVRAQLASTDHDVLEHFHEVVGCGSIVGPYLRRNRGPRKPLYIWNVTRVESVCFIALAFRPYLGERRREMADRVIETALGRIGKRVLHQSQPTSDGSFLVPSEAMSQLASALGEE